MLKLALYTFDATRGDRSIAEFLNDFSGSTNQRVRPRVGSAASKTGLLTPLRSGDLAYRRFGPVGFGLRLGAGALCTVKCSFTT